MLFGNMHNATESLISSGTSEAINGVENNLYTINDYGKNYCDCGRNYNERNYNDYGKSYDGCNRIGYSDYYSVGNRRGCFLRGFRR